MLLYPNKSYYWKGTQKHSFEIQSGALIIPLFSYLWSLFFLFFIYAGSLLQYSNFAQALESSG